MNTRIDTSHSPAGATQSPRQIKAKAASADNRKLGDAILVERRIYEIMPTVDKQIDGLTDSQRDLLLRELMKTFEAML